MSNTKVKPNFSSIGKNIETCDLDILIMKETIIEKLIDQYLSEHIVLRQLYDLRRSVKREIKFRFQVK